uniref:Uncharacterized protein n=1 Tax=Anopheles albimanus TaxID=7167 RepID=A0A182FXN5_ANOAL
VAPRIRTYRRANRITCSQVRRDGCPLFSPFFDLFPLELKQETVVANGHSNGRCEEQVRRPLERGFDVDVSGSLPRLLVRCCCSTAYQLATNGPIPGTFRNGGWPRTVDGHSAVLGLRGALLTTSNLPVIRRWRHDGAAVVAGLAEHPLKPPGGVRPPASHLAPQEPVVSVVSVLLFRVDDARCCHTYVCVCICVGDCDTREVHLGR